jgi:hypothetical protein
MEEGALLLLLSALVVVVVCMMLVVGVGRDSQVPALYCIALVSSQL